MDVKELKENYPDFALVLEVNDNKPPNFSDLAYKKVPVHDVEVGSYILVKDGEVCVAILLTFFFFYNVSSFLCLLNVLNSMLLIFITHHQNPNGSKHHLHSVVVDT